MSQSGSRPFFMKQLYTILLAIGSVTICMAQNPDGQLSDVTFGKTAITQFSETIEPSNKPYYIDENWLVGEFQILNNVKFKELPMRFNLIDNQLYFKDRKVVRVISANLLKGFSWTNLNGEIESFIIGNTIGFDTDAVFRIAIQDSVSLYSKNSTKIIKANYNEALSIGDKTDKIKLVREFYFQIKNGNLVKLENSRKKVLAAIPDQYFKEVDYFINANKLKFKYDQDFVELIKYWNTLYR